MDGSVGVNSLPNQGSQFWFEVRFLRGKSTFLQRVEDTTEFAQMINASVLLVEDNLFNQQVALEMLRSMGARVSIANNGQEAIDMLLQHHFDCVLMDVQMPVMDGLEATRQIRANPALCKIHIIAMTANAGIEDRDRCFAAGMNNFITKPIMAEKFFAAIKQCMQGTEQNQVAEAPDTLAAQTQVVAVPQAEPATGGDAVALIDLNVLAKSLGPDPVLLQKFARKFLHNAQQGLAEIQAALDKGDMAELAALGHRNKSPARTVGALAYAELCLALEKFREGGNPAQARDIFTRMQNMLEQISKEIS
jgi:two-component system sensor histidine kinase/response regulator